MPLRYRVVGAGPAGHRHQRARTAAGCQCRSNQLSGIDFDIEQAAGTSDFLPLARLTLRHVDPTCDDIAFDPTLHSDPKVKLVPGWLGVFYAPPVGAVARVAAPNNGQAVGSSLVSSTSGVCSRVAMPLSPPSSVGPGRPPLGSSARSSS